MITNKYNCNSFNVYTIKTEKFKTTHIEVLFRDYVKKDELCSRAFLCEMLTDTCNEYKSRRELMTRFEELYKMSVYGNTLKVGKVLHSSFILDFINPEYINDNSYLSDVIKLFFSMITKPNVVNNEFRKNEFNIVKERLKREIESLTEDSMKDSIRQALKSMDETSVTSFDLLGTIEDLDKITPSNLYKTYQSMMKNSSCDIFVIGNTDMDNLVELIKKYFNNRYIKENTLDIFIDNKTKSKVNIDSRISQNSMDNLVMIFNTVDLLKEERDITMHVFNYIFGSGGLTSKLYQSLREQNSMCYGVSSMYLKYDNLLLVQVSLDSKNTKKAIELIKREVDNMKRGKFSDEEVSDAISNMIVSLDLQEDSNVSILNNYVFNVYTDLPDLEKRKELFKKVSKEDVVNVAKKIKLNTIFTLKGESNGES